MPPKIPRAHPKGRQIDDRALGEVRALLDGAGVEDVLSAHHLIENLHLLQDAFGHISAHHLAALAHLMKLSQTEVYEVATFYAHFDVVKENADTPPPLTVRVCESITCALEGAAELTDALSDALGDRVRVVKMPCMGGCDTAPFAMIGTGRLSHAGVDTVRDHIKAATIGADITLPPDAEPLDAYRAGGGYGVLDRLQKNELKASDVLGAIEASGLRGLGGAGFPVARKWQFLDGKAKPRAVAVNADEGEPGTFKDRHIFETRPHRVIEGALIAAHVVEADDIYIYLRDEYPHIRALLLGEIEKVRRAGLNGRVNLHLKRGAGAYICGEETALLESLEGKRGLPRNRPPFPAEEGLFGRPTLINNVETLYWVTEIMEKGAEWYQGEGRPHFYSVSGRVDKPGVYLAPSGVSAHQLINDYAGGMADGHTFKGFLPGGASGGILPASLADEPLDFGTLEKHGCFIGSSAVVMLSDKDDVRAVAMNLLHFFADESCGQCTPCRSGCEKMLTLLQDNTPDKALITELTETMRDASICGLGQAAPNPVMSAFTFFPKDMTSEDVT